MEIIIGLIVVFAIISWFFSFRARNSQNYMDELIANVDRAGLSGELDAIHLDGLDFAKGTEIKIRADNDTISFNSNGMEIKLDMKRVMGIETVKLESTLDDNRFSISRALIGGAIFGGAGSLIGGFSSNVPSLLSVIINYIDKKDEVKYIVISKYCYKPGDKVVVQFINSPMIEFVHKVQHVLNKTKKTEKIIEI